MNHQKVSNFRLLFMSLLTALIVNSHILAGIYFVFQKKASLTKLERLSIPSLSLSEKIEKVALK